MAVRKTKKGEVTFIYDKKPAKTVYLAGDFNNWDPKAKRMTKAKDGSYRAKLSLDPGEHQYKFVADGKWIEDRDADKLVQNQFGGINSVIEI